MKTYDIILIFYWHIHGIFESSVWHLRYVAWHTWSFHDTLAGICTSGIFFFNKAVFFFQDQHVLEIFSTYILTLGLLNMTLWIRSTTHSAISMTHLHTQRIRLFILVKTNKIRLNIEYSYVENLYWIFL